eukprot:gnl/Spiro4/4775_TR2394_c0_g1_i1.p1 gnl/Spiro4/4775_TR2394_c0_g1~~gnl/Spiro4/4775_TR2394_c0_g1_i1.p1  ORF type:complete len:824 (+),score=229.14 gnl/Spiro4/4775_TR2394_c0_g1_i1:39-2474(+)
MLPGICRLLGRLVPSGGRGVSSLPFRSFAVSCRDTLAQAKSRFTLGASPTPVGAVNSPARYFGLSMLGTIATAKETISRLFEEGPPGFENFFNKVNQHKKKGKSGGDSDDKKPPDERQINGLYLLIPAAILAALYMLPDQHISGTEISWEAFLRDHLEPRTVESLNVVGSEGNYMVVATLKAPVSEGGSPSHAGRRVRFGISSVDSFERKIEAAQLNMDIAPRDFVPVTYTHSKSRENLVGPAMTLVFFLGSIYLFRQFTKGITQRMGGQMGGLFDVSKSKAKKITPDMVKQRFKDVAGLHEAKKEVMEFVDFLKNPAKYTILGARIPSGALLVGPPGTGKTLLAKATAGEAEVPFYSVSGSDFLEMFVGVGPARVRDLFKTARENAPCLIFIDEIDAVGRARGKGGFSGGHDEREATLNQLLVEMDGFSSGQGVVVLAGTNRADVLDPALLRPGRFDRRILVDKPDIEGREEIFNVHLQPLKLSQPISSYAKRLAALTPGFVGAEIANICNEAALIAAREDKKYVDTTSFEKAVDRVIGGLERKNLMSMSERLKVATHEAGHALTGWFLEHAEPLVKVSIVPRGQALGFAQYLPGENALMSREQLLDTVCMALGGRAAEELSFATVSTGASDDLKKVTKIVYNQVAVWGMNERVGLVSFPQEEENQFTKPYSESLAQVIDEEVKIIVDAAYKRTKDLLTEKADLLKQVADLLLSKETIDQADLIKIVGERPFQKTSNHENFLRSGVDAWENAKKDMEKPAEELDATVRARVEAELKLKEQQQLEAAAAASPSSTSTTTPTPEKNEQKESV